MLASKLLAASVPPVQWPAHAHPPLSLARSSLQDPSISKNKEETSDRAADRENIFYAASLRSLTLRNLPAIVSARRARGGRPAF